MFKRRMTQQFKNREHEVAEMIDLLNQELLSEFIYQNVCYGEQLMVDFNWVTRVNKAELYELSAFNPFFINELIDHLQIE